MGKSSHNTPRRTLITRQRIGLGRPTMMERECTIRRLMRDIRATCRGIRMESITFPAPSRNLPEWKTGCQSIRNSVMKATMPTLPKPKQWSIWKSSKNSSGMRMKLCSRRRRCQGLLMFLKKRRELIIIFGMLRIINMIRMIPQGIRKCISMLQMTNWKAWIRREALARVRLLESSRVHFA